VDVIVKGRHIELDERFRTHVTSKLAKVAKLDGRVARVDVEVCEERNPRQGDRRCRVELTCRSRGSLARAEAAAPECYAALDLALAKLEERLRRAADRRRVHHGIRTPVSVAAATAPLGAAPTTNGSGPAPTDEVDETDDEQPALVVREKLHAAAPMTLDEALFGMELVGHDFYLFVDAATGRPSVVYRRRGYDYGVIRLDQATEPGP
jgi:ribosomal subunit interface protein